MPDKEYLTYEEAMELLNVKRSTLYSMITDMDVQTHKFKRDKRRYLAASDVNRMKELREKPWLAGSEEKPKEDAA